MFILLSFFFLLNFMNILYIIYQFYQQFLNKQNDLKWNNFYKLLYLNKLKYYFIKHSKNKCINDIKNKNHTIFAKKEQLKSLLNYKIVIADLDLVLKNKDLFNTISLYCNSNYIKIYIIGDLIPTKFSEELVKLKFYNNKELIKKYISPYNYYNTFFNQTYKIVGKHSTNKVSVNKKQMISDILDENKINKEKLITLNKYLDKYLIDYNITHTKELYGNNSDENNSDENNSDENNSDENNSDENESDENESDENELDENESDENESDENISDESDENNSKDKKWEKID